MCNVSSSTAVGIPDITSAFLHMPFGRTQRMSHGSEQHVQLQLESETTTGHTRPNPETGLKPNMTNDCHKKLDISISNYYKFVVVEFPA
uniref:Uncharacterized protein n=1 Tax=Arundo donax TaxID=35708 RepID=A0A0A9CIE5_ARUDO